MTTQLPEPDFIDRDPETITQEWIDLYEEKTGKTLQNSQIERLMIDTGAYRETVLRNKIQETAKQNLLSYAPLEVLEHIGEPLGVTKLPADYASADFKFSIDEALDFDFTIGAGTEIETSDGLFIFQTTESVILTAGSTEITVNGQCETAGTAANNYKIGSINNLITPLSYITGAENTTVSSGGADDEDADSLRERIRQAPEKFSNAGSKGAYIYHTLSAHQSIIDAAVLSPSPGTVYIYPLTSDGKPQEEIINTVQEYLNDEKIRPLTDYVVVKPPESIQFNINAVVILYSYADIDTVKAAIDAKLNEYKAALSEKLGKSVIQSQIIAILNNIYGVYKVTLNSPDNDIEISSYQWAELTDFDITIGGYTDE